MSVRRKSRARKASWIAFGVVALAVMSCVAQESYPEERDVMPQETWDDTNVQLVLSQDDQYVQGVYNLTR